MVYDSDIIALLMPRHTAWYLADGPVGTSSDILSIRLPRLGNWGPPVTLHTNNTMPYHIMTTVLHVNLLLITVSLWGNPLVTYRVSPKRASNVELWCLPSRKPEQTFEQAGRFETQILMGVPMTLSWSPCYWLKISSVGRFYKLFKFSNHAMNNILVFFVRLVIFEVKILSREEWCCLIYFIENL